MKVTELYRMENNTTTKHLTNKIMKQKIINKMNEGQESDVPLYTWATIPKGLRMFWHKYYLNKQ
jgi:hypothetical protein